MRSSAAQVVVASLVCLFATACATVDPTAAPEMGSLPLLDTTPQPTLPISMTDDSSPTNTPALTNDSAFLDAAMLALAGSLGVPTESLSLLEPPRLAEWPDSSLGCPEPGQAYDMAITSGVVFILSDGGQAHEVHTDLAGRSVICRSQEEIVAEQSDEITDHILEEFIFQVTADLATRLSISESDISVLNSESMEWADAAIGCPEADQIYAAVITAGYRIVLSAGGSEYHYHTDQHRFLLCQTPTE